MTEDEMVGWHHRLDGHGFEWTPGVGDGQGGLACCGSWGHKELDMTEQLNWTRQTFVGKVISLLFIILSRLGITFLPRSQLFTSGGQSIGVSASTSVLPMNT